MSWSDTSSYLGDGASSSLSKAGQSTMLGTSTDDDPEVDQCACGSIWAPPHTVFCHKCGRKRLDKLEELRLIEMRLENAWRAAEGSVVSSSMEELKRTQERLDEAKRLAEARLKALLAERAQVPDDIPAGYRKWVEQIERDGWDKVSWAKDFTLLHWAAKKNRAELVARFMQQGANPYQKDVLGKSAFDYANESGEDQALTQLVVQVPAGIPDTYVKAIQQLDSVGWELMLFARGFTLLHWAAKRDRPELVARFLRQGGDPHQRDETGRSALDYAIANGNDKALVQMLAYFLPPGQVQRLFKVKNLGWDAVEWENGVTLLHWGAEKGDLELCRYLVKQEADPTMQDQYGRTPLQLAIDHGYGDVEHFFKDISLSKAAAERLRTAEVQAAELKEAMQRLEAEKRLAERAATQKLADLAAEKERAARQAAEKAKQEAEQEAQKKLEETVKAVERSAQEKVERLARQAEEEKQAAEKLASKRAEEDRANAQRLAAEQAAAQKRRMDMELFSQRVATQLSSRLYRELNESLQAGKRELHETEEGQQRFRDAVLSVSESLREQHDDARHFIRSAKINLPGRLDTAKFDTSVVQITRGLDVLSTAVSSGGKATELIGDIAVWRKNILDDCSGLLSKMVEEADTALSKWYFHKVLQIQEDVTVVSGVTALTDNCSEAIAKLRAKFSKGIDALDSDLASMVEFGHAAGAVECAVQPRRIDDLFSGLRRSAECDSDFEEISRRLIRALEVRVGELYGAARMAIQRGDMKQAEVFMKGTSDLQTSVTVTSSTTYNQEVHARFLQEALINRSVARRDPAGFNQRLNVLMNTDAVMYAKSIEPLRVDLMGLRAGLDQSIKGLRMQDEQQLEGVISGLVDMYCYGVAVASHFDDELRFQDLLGTFECKLRGLVAPIAGGEGMMNEVVSTWQYLRTAMDRLGASEAPPLVRLGQGFSPALEALEQRMSQQAEQVCTGWDIVDMFDICQDNPPVAALVNYLGMLDSSQKYLKSSQKVGDQISFDLAVQKIRGKVSSLDKEALWQECKALPSKGQSKRDVRLIIVLLNLQRLAKDRPETGAGEARDTLVDFVLRRLRALQEQTVLQFKRVMDPAIAVVGLERSQELKAINRQLEESTRVRSVLKSLWELFPDQDQDLDKVVEFMKETASSMHHEFMQRSTLDIDKIAVHLVSVYEVASAVSSDPVRTHVNQIIGGYLKQLFQKKAVDFCDLAQALCDQGPLGGQIVDDFEQFRQYKLDRIRTKTAGMTFEHALQQLAELNMQMHQTSFQSLESAWSVYTHRYEGLLDEYMFSGPQALHQEVCDEVSAVRSGRGNRSVPELLAGICAAVSLEMSAERQSRKESMMHPHPVQVLALFRLLQVDCPASQRSASGEGWGLDQSHLIQICTGEGKSIVLGVLSIFLALFGFDVDCVCYSTYLSVRDYKAFSGLFQSFGVKDKICYGTFGELARRHVNQHGDVRAFVQSLFDGGRTEVGKATASTQARRRGKILLIDEVDVFFSRDFYGGLYCPSVLHKSPEVAELLTFIWEGRGQAMSLERVQAAPIYKRLEARYFPKLKQLIDSQIRALLHATTTYTAPEHSYEVQDGRIGYVEHGTVNTSIMHGYNTTFCYFKERERGTIDPDVFEEILGLNICCGRFSYAEIPLVYTQMLGVTGTLSSLGQFEEGVIKDVYHISSKTLMPSMYGKRDANFNQGVHVERGKGGYHRKIQDEINYVMSAERAVLVFFESEERLHEFMSSEYGQRLKDTASVVTTGTSTEVDHYVKQATRSREVTLFTRVFGRGLDFVCFDKTVMARGGVAVIQTFLSEDIAEEIQIMGRTCRQGERGTYKMILLAEDLTGWIQAKEKQTDDSSAPAPKVVSDTSPARRKSSAARPQYSKQHSFSVDLASLDDAEEIDLMALDDEAVARAGKGAPMEFDLAAIEEGDEGRGGHHFAPAPRQVAVKPEPKDCFITLEEIESLQASGGGRLYEVLDQRRRSWFTKESQERARVVERAKKAHARSVEFQNNMKLISHIGVEEKVVTFLNSINAGVPGGSSASYHTVFCLDESYSMSGARWEQLNQAFNQFLCTRTEESGAQDIISVVQFATDARVTLACASLAEAIRFKLEMKHGATFFRPPLEYALQLIQQARETHPSLVPLLIFMSDGENKDGDPAEMMRSMFIGIKGLIFHAVFFGHSDEPGCDLLHRMAQAFPGGKFHLSSDDGLELVSTFQGIAADITAL